MRGLVRDRQIQTIVIEEVFLIKIFSHKET